MHELVQSEVWIEQSAGPDQFDRPGVRGGGCVSHACAEGAHLILDVLIHVVGTDEICSDGSLNHPRLSELARHFHELVQRDVRSEHAADLEQVQCLRVLNAECGSRCVCHVSVSCGV